MDDLVDYYTYILDTCVCVDYMYIYIYIWTSYYVYRTFLVVIVYRFERAQSHVAVARISPQTFMDVVKPQCSPTPRGIINRRKSTARMSDKRGSGINKYIIIIILKSRDVLPIVTCDVVRKNVFSVGLQFLEGLPMGGSVVVVVFRILVLFRKKRSQ